MLTALRNASQIHQAGSCLQAHWKKEAQSENLDLEPEDFHSILRILASLSQRIMPGELLELSETQFPHIYIRNAVASIITIIIISEEHVYNY